MSSNELLTMPKADLFENHFIDGPFLRTLRDSYLWTINHDLATTCVARHSIMIYEEPENKKKFSPPLRLKLTKSLSQYHDGDEWSEDCKHFLCSS